MDKFRIILWIYVFGEKGLFRFFIGEVIFVSLGDFFVLYVILCCLYSRWCLKIFSYSLNIFLFFIYKKKFNLVIIRIKCIIDLKYIY